MRSRCERKPHDLRRDGIRAATHRAGGLDVANDSRRADKIDGDPLRPVVDCRDGRGVEQAERLAWAAGCQLVDAFDQVVIAG